MGIASTVFFDGNDSEKQTLHRRITLSKEQFDEQQERWNELAEELVRELAASSGCQVTTWLQGSYKFGTQIRPVTKSGEFDIDLGIYFWWEGITSEWEFQAQDIKRLVQSALTNYNHPDVIDVAEPPKEKCDGQEINRQAGDFHFWFTVGLPKGDGFKIVELRFVIFRHRPDEIQYANESFLYEDDTVDLISKIEKINRLTS